VVVPRRKVLYGPAWFSDHKAWTTWCRRGRSCRISSAIGRRLGASIFSRASKRDSPLSPPSGPGSPHQHGELSVRQRCPRRRPPRERRTRWLSRLSEVDTRHAFIVSVHTVVSPSRPPTVSRRVIGHESRRGFDVASVCAWRSLSVPVNENRTPAHDAPAGKARAIHRTDRCFQQPEFEYQPMCRAGGIPWVVGGPRVTI